MAAELGEGSELAGYRIQGELARGGMGVVFRATQLSLERQVALKVVAPELSGEEEFRRRFLREARAAAALDHPHVLPVYEAGEEEGVLYLAMRLVEGESLAEVLLQEGALVPARAALISSQLAEALQSAHAAGLVHRDVKPANVLLAQVGAREHVYLCDFGIARFSQGTELTEKGGFLGTVSYASPEQIRGETVDDRSDLYSLGCLLYECLTGAPPFKREHDAATLWAQLNAPAPLPSEALPELGDRFDGIVERALAKDPSERFQSGEEFAEAVASDAPPLPRRASPLATTTLPTPASSFLGREQELVEVGELLAREGVRLLTLTGPGGTGKTRLALRAATRAADIFPDGVVWVGLATLRDPALVTETIAQTLGAKDGLAEHIGDRELLLLLDNLEQVIDSAPELASLVSSCPKLTVLVTSRERLRVQGEVEYPVPPLAEPEAVSLFCERSRLEPSEEIAELCARLDSLPLAVELAAARTSALSSGQILERLSQRLDLLKGGRDADPRQQTLRTTIEWSYDLLSDGEQRLFRRLSVFSGGCTLEAAEEVADAHLDTLQSLVEKSLLRFSNERYWMLETIREYAGDRLEESRESDVIRGHQRAYIVALVEAIAEKLQSGDEAVASAQLAPEYGNVRAAVSHALAAGEPDDVGRILGAIFPFLITHGYLTDGTEWTAAALAAGDRLSAHGLAETLLGGGEVARFAGDLSRAIELKEELVSVHRDHPRFNVRAGTLADLSEIALEQGDFVRARRYIQESAEAGGGARVALCLAELALRLGDLDSARSNALAAVDEYVEGEFNHACALEILGEASRRSGDFDAARRFFRDGLRSFAGLGDGGGVADCLDGLSRLAEEARADERASVLCGAAQQLRRMWGRRPIRTDAPPIKALESARERGAMMTIDDAVEYALTALD